MEISTFLSIIFFWCVPVYTHKKGIFFSRSNKIKYFSLSLYSRSISMPYVLIFIFDFDLGWIFCWHFAIKFDWFSTNWFEIDTSCWSCGLYVSDRWSTRSGYVYNERFTFGKLLLFSFFSFLPIVYYCVAFIGYCKYKRTSVQRDLILMMK